MDRLLCTACRSSTIFLLRSRSSRYSSNALAKERLCFLCSCTADLSQLQTVGPELIHRIRSDDRDAFRTLFHVYYPALHRFARGLLGDPEDADDVIQDVFFRLWRNRRDLGEQGSIRSYLFTGIRNRALDLLRRRRREQERYATGAGTAAPEEFEEQWHTTTACPLSSSSIHEIPEDHSDSDPAALAELRAAIRDAVGGLPERCRTAFLLCRERDMTYAEAAEIMGVTPATVKTQMGRALVAIRAALRPFLSLLVTASSLIR